MKTTTTTNLSPAMAAIRAACPALRRTRATAITHSGSRRTVYTCLCGAVHTTSTDWNGRGAKHVRDWRADHDACAEVLARGLPAALVSR